jgi:hypothetical protein
MLFVVVQTILQFNTHAYQVSSPCVLPLATLRKIA